MKILFLTKRKRLNQRGLTPIMCRVTIDKTRKEFSTGVFVRPEYRSKEKQKVLETRENSKIINSQLSLIKQKLGQAFLMLQIQEKSFHVVDIYKIYIHENVRKEMGVMAMYEEHNIYYKKLIGKDMKVVSWQKFENAKNHLQNFLQWKYKKKELAVSSLRYQFIKDFNII